MNQLLMSKKDNYIYVVLMDEYNRMIECHPFKLSSIDFPNVSNIYNGIVRKAVKGIGAYFVDIGHEKDGYLPMDLVSKNLSVGENVMVQVTKEPYETKGAKLTGFISLSSENLVLVTDTNKIHFSKKLPEDDKTKAIKACFSHLDHDEYGFIVRTNAYNKSIAQIKEEIKSVVDEYKSITDTYEYKLAPKTIYKKELPYIQLLQDIYKKDLSKILVDNMTLEDEVKEYLSKNNLSNKIELVFSDFNLYSAYDLKKKIERACSRKIWLKSGASIIIDKTEAMTVIDVNSDKNIKSKKQSNNILAINLEAVKEIARIIRLRNISGIIIIDFIDMESEMDKEELTMMTVDYLEKDPTLTKVHGLTTLGLMEISRKRAKPTLCERLSR